MWIARKTSKQINAFREEHAALIKAQKEFEAYKKEHEALVVSQRNQLKAQIVEIYERARDRKTDPNWNHPWLISYMELDTLNRLADSYFELGGNHYVHSVVKKANRMPVGGEEIPA